MILSIIITLFTNDEFLQDPNTICRGLHICRASDDKEDKDDIDMVRQI